MDSDIATRHEGVPDRDASPLSPLNEESIQPQDSVNPSSSESDPIDVPHLAPVEALWSRPVRTIVIGVVIGAILVYLLFGSILARNVTFNRLIDEGAYNGIRRFQRETIMEVWRSMWDKAPDFGSIDLTRSILLISTVVFFAAFALIIALIFVPSRQEWAAGLGEGQESDTISGD